MVYLSYRQLYAFKRLMFLLLAVLAKMISVAMSHNRIFILLWTMVSPTLQDCPGTPTILKQDFYGSMAVYHASNALMPDCGNGGTWIAPDHNANTGFTLDYGNVYHADGFHLRNDPNRSYDDRLVFLTFLIPFCLILISHSTVGQPRISLLSTHWTMQIG